jgi:hypothetical protein
MLWETLPSTYKFNVRLVAKGFRQVEGRNCDDIYVPIYGGCGDCAMVLADAVEHSLHIAV